MQYICIFYRLCLENNVIFEMISSRTIKQNFSILHHLVGEISHFEFDAYRESLTGASDLKLFVGGVWFIVYRLAMQLFKNKKTPKNRNWHVWETIDSLS